MEPGKLCVMGQGKDGPYYNLQCRENGKPVSRYMSRDHVETVQQNTENCRTFERPVDQYAQEIITRTRQERLAGKEEGPRPSSGSKTPKSRS